MDDVLKELESKSRFGRGVTDEQINAWLSKESFVIK